MSPTQLLPIGEVSRRTGVAVSALHYYEQLGLISSQRTSGNQRRFARHMMRRISLIRVAKRLGIPLESVRAALAGLPADRKPTMREWQRISQKWDAELEARKRAIEQLQQELTGCIGCGCLSMSKCRLLNLDDKLGAVGPGARRLDDLSGEADRRTRRRSAPATPAAASR
nr:redox-sensitive transcriptional activator SoxR [Fodinicola acaciae]